MHYKLLAEVTSHHKTNPEEIRKMSSVIEEILEEGREEGRIKGREEGMTTAMRRMLDVLLQEGKFSCEEMAKYTSLPLDEVQQAAECHHRRQGLGLQCQKSQG